MIDPVVDALLPPAILALLAFAFVVAGRRRAAIYALVALLVLAVQGVPQMLVGLLLLPPSSSAPDPVPGAIVVLASGLPELLDTSRTTPSLETLERLRTAAALSRATGKPILASGARSSDGLAPVGTQMAVSLAADFRVPATWTETRSGNLWQSAAATAAILRRAGIGEIYLVAQPWELRLSASVFRAAGLLVVPAPVPYGGPRALDLTSLAVVTPAWLDTALVVREWSGLACQAVSYCTAWMRARPMLVTPDPS